MNSRPTGDTQDGDVPSDDVAELVRSIRAGSRRAVGRGVTWIESRDTRADELLSRLGEDGAPSPRAFRLGVTGAPGVGKSSLVARLIGRLRTRGERVAVIAVDPTSPLSGGALLGDRLRMRGHQDDDGVFIRSVASRSGVGGLAASTDEVAELLAYAGYGFLLIETVGVGQLELAIAGEAHHVLLLISPEGGDVIQFLKAGLFEVVDRVVVNKSDRPGADETFRVVRQLATERDEPEPLAVSCETEEGFDELVEVVLEEAAALRRADKDATACVRMERRLRRRVEERWIARAWRRLGGVETAVQSAAQSVVAGEDRFADAVEALLHGGEFEPGGDSTK